MPLVEKGGKSVIHAGNLILLKLKFLKRIYLLNHSNKEVPQIVKSMEELWNQDVKQFNLFIVLMSFDVNCAWSDFICCYDSLNADNVQWISCSKSFSVILLKYVSEILYYYFIIFFLVFRKVYPRFCSYITFYFGLYVVYVVCWWFLLFPYGILHEIHFVWMQSISVLRFVLCLCFSLSLTSCISYLQFLIVVESHYVVFMLYADCFCFLFSFFLPCTWIFMAWIFFLNLDSNVTELCLLYYISKMLDNKGFVDKNVMCVSFDNLFFWIMCIYISEILYIRYILLFKKQKQNPQVLTPIWPSSCFYFLLNDFKLWPCKLYFKDKSDETWHNLGNKDIKS